MAELTKPKPQPTDAIVTDAQAAERYNADIEAWGDGVSASGVRLCHWFNAQGAEFDCPK